MLTCVASFAQTTMVLVVCLVSVLVSASTKRSIRAINVLDRGEKISEMIITRMEFVYMNT